MKVILAFVIGAVLGAVSTFFYLRQIGHDPYVAAAPVAIVVTAPVAVNPAAPVITTDLSEANLPIRPALTAEVAVEAANTAALSEAKAAMGVPGSSAPSAWAAPAVAAAAAGGAKLMVPVEGFKLAQLSDTFDQPRGTERHHEAMDIMAPTGTKVVAVADGKVAKLFNSKPGGLTVYQFDPTEKFAYYYAHLDRYAEGLKEGAPIKRGELIGYVGATGNANPAAPHLHFAVVQLTPEKQWWKGTPVNPYPMLGD